MAADDYVTEPAELQPGTRARASEVEEKLDALKAGFGILPAPRNDGKKGFSVPITLEEPTEAGHAATRNFVETGVTSGVVAAQTAQTAAETAQSNAATSASQAATSAAAAATSASQAATSASGAAASSTTASGHADAAAASEANAATSAANASTSASQASTSAGAASTSASQASTSASAASTSASQAATSATNASTSASQASTSAASAATSSSNSANSASAAAASATAAQNAADDAEATIAAALEGAQRRQIDVVFEAAGESGGGAIVGTKDGRVHLAGERQNFELPYGSTLFDPASPTGLWTPPDFDALTLPASYDAPDLVKAVRNNKGGFLLFGSEGTVVFHYGDRDAGFGSNALDHPGLELVTHGNAGSTQIVDIATGGARGTNGSLFVIRSGGQCLASGENTAGQLGRGSVNAYETALAEISGGLAVAKVSVGVTHTLFLLQNGQVYAAGSNANGELGNGTTTPSTTPVRCGTLSGISKIIAAGDIDGNPRSYALAADGTLYGWGDGSNYMMDSSATDKTSPVVVDTGVSDFSFTGGGKAPSLFWIKNAELYYRGTNTYGEYGRVGDTHPNANALHASAGFNAGVVTGVWTTPPLWEWGGAIVQRSDDGGLQFAGRNQNGAGSVGNTALNRTTWSAVVMPLNYTPTHFVWSCRYDGVNPVHQLYSIDAEGRLCAAGSNAGGELGLVTTAYTNRYFLTPCYLPE